jgi:hypothetical protein
MVREDLSLPQVFSNRHAISDHPDGFLKGLAPHFDGRDVIIRWHRGVYLLRREDRHDGGLLGGNGLTEGVSQHAFTVADTEVLTVHHDRAAVSA